MRAGIAAIANVFARFYLMRHARNSSQCPCSQDELLLRISACNKSCGNVALPDLVSREYGGRVLRRCLGEQHDAGDLRLAVGRQVPPGLLAVHRGLPCWRDLRAVVPQYLILGACSGREQNTRKQRQQKQRIARQPGAERARERERQRQRQRRGSPRPRRRCDERRTGHGGRVGRRRLQPVSRRKGKHTGENKAHFIVWTS